MGPGLLVAGVLLGITFCFLCGLCVYLNGKARHGAGVIRQLAKDVAQRDIDIENLKKALAHSTAPVTIRISDEQALRMAHLIWTSIEEMRKAELGKLN